MTHAALKDLLPCPFCGGEATATNYVVEAAVRCGGCGATVMRQHPPMNGEGLPAAITAWNRRAALSAMEGEAVQPAFWISAADFARANAEGDNVIACPATGDAPDDSVFLYAAPPPQQAERPALNDELERFKVQVEKRLCAILGKHWQPAGGGICIDNLCEEIAARFATQPQQAGGDVVVTRDERGLIVAVSRQDSDGRILKIIAENPEYVMREASTPPQPEAGGGEAWKRALYEWAAENGMMAHADNIVRRIAALSTTPASGGEHG